MGIMRIKILRKPSVASIDGVRLDRFQPGQQYDVGNTLAGLLLAEGWAEPITSDEPAVVIPFNEFDAGASIGPANLTREIFPPYYDAPPALAAERRRRRRSR